MKAKVSKLINNKLVVDYFSDRPNRLFMRIPKNREDWSVRVRAVVGNRWHPNLKLWSIPYCKDTVRHFHNIFKGVVFYNFTISASIPDHYNPKRRKRSKKIEILPKHEEERIRLVEQLHIQRYSHSTIKSYKAYFKAFLLYYNEIDPKEISEKQILKYIFYIVTEKKVAKGTQGQIINAIKFYYEQVLNQERKTYYLKRPKKSKKLPNILSEEEVTRLINSTKNIKHKCILMLLYSGGLRIGEVVNLMIKDIRSDQSCIFIRDAKGNKDRYTLLSPKLLNYLREYFRLHRPSYWLFEGQYGGQYSTRSINHIFTAAKIKSNINLLATPHSLRHSFATHLVHRGINLRYIQELLGHASSKTTEIYTHIAKTDLQKLQSPLENLNI